MIRVALLAAMIWSLGGTAASADTLSLAQYLMRLREARTLIQAGQPAEARALLRQTTALEVADGTIGLDDGPLATRLTAPAGVQSRALADLDAYIALVTRAAARPIDPGSADAALREVIGGESVRTGSGSLVDAIVRALQRLGSGLEGPRPDPLVIVQAIAGLGLALLLFVLGTLGRGLRERVRGEVVLRGAGVTSRADPAAHLAAADRAIGEGHAREAVHALYLYALTALASREAIRYDPALTDRELLMRAAGIPHAEALRDLVTLYERTWFGLREPATDEARRARALAVRVTG